MRIVRSSRLYLILTLLGVVVLGSGCATGRDALRLEVPAATAVATSSGKSALIRSVQDKRQFEEKPSKPSTPSLGETDTPAARKQAVARKRNSYGKALGDVVLEEGQTVETVVRNALAVALRDAGYRVLGPQEQPRPDTLALDVSIDRFWAWMNPGFTALSFRSEIVTRIQVNDGGRQYVKSIDAAGELSAQVGTLSKWREVLSRALTNYVKNARETFATR
jgi:hypothetical protein